MFRIEFIPTMESVVLLVILLRVFHVVQGLLEALIATQSRLMATRAIRHALPTLAS